jgi:hypothetical protein
MIKPSVIEPGIWLVKEIGGWKFRELRGEGIPWNAN